MTDEERELILSYAAEGAMLDDAARARLRERFLRAYPVDLRAHPEYLDEELERAAHARDGGALECALTLGGFMGGLDRRHVPLLSRVLPEPWHHCHEDIAWALQHLASAGSEEALYVTAVADYSYLDYDEVFALARKCAWALGDIGTPAAVQKLRLLLQSDNPVKREHALEQIRRLGLEP